MEKDNLIITEIFWDDFETYSGWHDVEDIEDLVEEQSYYRTVGYVIYEDDNYLFVGASACSDGGFGEVMKVPKSQIRARHELRHRAVKK